LQSQFPPKIRLLPNEPPRIDFFHKPTPIFEMQRIFSDSFFSSLPSTSIPKVYIKRDDVTGEPTITGNKIRKLEYLLADALLQKNQFMYDFVVCFYSCGLFGFLCVYLFQIQNNLWRISK
jgi:hypothetical protein